MVQRWCNWKRAEEEDGTESWDTGCLAMMMFIEGGPKDNGFRFCPYCGAWIREIKEWK